MPEKKLPETNKPKTAEVKKAAEQKGPGILSERFPAVSKVLTKSKDTLSERALELTTKKTKERGYKQIQSNLSSLDKMMLLAEEQNMLLREIINVLKETDGPSIPGRGRRPPRGRARPRGRPPGRGRFGRRAQQRLRRMQRAQRLRAATAVKKPTVVERVRATGRRLVDRVRAPAPTRTRIEPTLDRRPTPTVERPPPTTERPPPTEDVDRVRRAQADADKIVADADDKARRTVTEAEEKARRTIADAEERAKTQTEDADKIRSQAQEEARRIKSAAEAEAESIRRQANTDADTVRNRANADAEKIRREAQTTRQVTPEPDRVQDGQRAQPAAPPEAEKVGERTVAGRRVTFNERTYNRTVAGIRLGGGVLAVVGAIGVADQVKELYALRQMNAENPEEGISEEDFQKELLVIVGGVFGGLAGGLVGAKLGTILGGLTGGPWGALAGGLAGGIFGGLQGEQAAELIGTAIFDQLTGSNKFEELWNRMQDEARRNLSAGASTLGAPPETEAEQIVQQQQAQEEQRQRQQAGIEQPFANTELEKIIRDLQKARTDLEKNPRNIRLQRTVKNLEESLRNLLNSPRFRLSPEDRQRALRFLQGEVERIDTNGLTTNLSAEDYEEQDVTAEYDEPERVQAEPIVRSLLQEEEMESALPYPENLIEMIGRTEFESIEIEADKISFEGEIKLTQAEAVTMDTAMGAPGGAPPPAPETDSGPAASIQTAAATALGGVSGGAPAAAPQQAATQVPAAAAGGQAPTPLATPVAMPSPAATGIPPAPQPEATPQQPQQGGQQAGGGDFMTEVNRVAGRLGVNPTNLLAIMRSESSLNPQAVNRSTGASGLIQFMPRTAQSLGTSVEAIRQMTAAQQMPFVEKFFQSVRLPPGASAGKMYAYVFLPGRANREVLTQSGENFYEMNKGLDVDKDGKITIADLDARLARYGAVGGAAPATMQAAAPATGGALASAGTGMVAADQAQARSGGQTVIVQTPGQQAAQAPNIVPQQTAAGEVPLNIRLQKQVA